MDEPLNDTELERLLAQLFRLVSPAVTAGGAGPGSPADGAGADEHQVRPAGPENGSLPGEPANGSRPAEIPAVSASEARALIELVAARGIAQGELGSLLGLEKSTVSRLAAGLERKGWVRRGRDEGNQRYVRLYLTPEGGVIAARVWQAWHSRQERIVRLALARGADRPVGRPARPGARPGRRGHPRRGETRLRGRERRLTPAPPRPLMITEDRAGQSVLNPP